MFMNDENKHHGQAINIASETTNDQKKKLTETTIFIHEDKY